MGKTTSGQFAEVVSLVIHKMAKDIPRRDKADLWQEAELALFLAKGKLEKHPAPERLAYRIVKNRIIDYIRTLHLQDDKGDKIIFKDITNPNTIRECNKQHIVYPNIDVKLDAEKAVHLVNQLPATEKFVLIMTFGLEDNPKFSERELAELMKKSEVWVSRTKKKALMKLRSIMER